MSNYYAISTTFIPGQKVASGDVNAELTAISAGFDLLPTDQNAIVEGKTYKGTEGGTGNSYTVTMDDTRTAYADGDRVSFKATHTNTGAVSLSLDGIGLLSLVDPAGDVLTPGAIVSGIYYEAIYVAGSNRFQLMSLHATLITDASDQVDYAEEWASKAEDSLISTAAGGDGATDYSALHWAAKAAADVVLTNADVVTTNADVVLTNADVVTTNADVVTTNADVVLTGLDAAATAADVITTAASAAAALVSENNADGYATSASGDAVATAADLVQTNLDQISCDADATSTAADAVSTAADAVLTAADVTYTAEWANKAEDSLVSAAAGGDLVDDYSALHWAAKAAASAATINLPAIIGGDADKILEVNVGETGYELTARQATDAATGFVELATDAEALAGTDTSRAVTPASMMAGLTSRTRKNLIINGNFSVWERPGSDAITAVATDEFAADRYQFFLSTGAVVDILRGVSPATLPSRFYMTFDVTTADASIGATEYFVMQNAIEGLDARHLMWGSAAAKTVTLSFRHAHTKTGTHCVVLRNSGNTRAYVGEYTQSVTDTWEEAVITIPGDTSGTWNASENAVGISLLFTAAVGSTYQTAAGAWTTGTYYGSSNQVNNLDSASNFMKFSDLQLEVGSEATDFAYRHYSEELAMCQRYYQSYVKNHASAAQYTTTTNVRAAIPTPVSMCSGAPTLISTLANWRLRSASGGNASPSAVSVNTSSNANIGVVSLDFTVAADTQYAAVCCYNNNPFAFETEI